MEIPPCPDPSHARGRVVRAGWYGKRPHRRQRWLCRPGNGEPPHRFSEVLPRQATAEHYCVECSTRLERWEGQAGAREYLFSAREVGKALALAAAGESFQRAARAARSAAHRTHRGLTGDRHRPRDPNLDGQIVANWVDVLAPIITTEELPGAWPECLAIDSLEFRINRGPRAGQSFHVFAAVGYAIAGPPRLWWMAAFPRRTEACWREFLEALEGRPALVVTDFDKALRKALRGVFPGSGDRAPELRLCELHVKRTLEKGLSPLDERPDHPVMDTFGKALWDERRWAAFEAEVKRAHERSAPQLPGMIRWLQAYGPAVGAQLRTRGGRGPRSIGAAEAALRQVEKAFLGRSQSFGNRARLDTLLALMTLHANGDADAGRWADRLRERLHPRGGLAPQQRPHDDPRGCPSLLA
jgi:hypothetical protein